MLDLLSADLRRDPYPLYDQMRAASPVAYAPPLDAWMVFDYAGVRRVLTDHDAFSSSVRHQTGRSPDWLIFTDPPRHERLRSIIVRAFTPRSIAALEPRVRAITHELLDQVAARGTMDVVADLAAPLPMRVVAELLGVPAEDHPRLARWADALANLIYVIAGGEHAAKALAAHTTARDEMRVRLRERLEARRAAPQDDLLTRLVQAEVDGERLDEDAILGFFQLLLSAGTETTTHLTSNAVLCFAEHPEQLARVRAEPACLPGAIEEVLRYRSPVAVMFRQTRREVALGEHVIPADRFVLAMVGAANRDPAQFPDAARFDVARDPNPHVAFGHGIHYCLGAALARLEGRVALGALYERVHGLALADDAPWEPRAALHVHGPASLRVRFDECKPPACER